MYILMKYASKLNVYIVYTDSVIYLFAWTLFNIRILYGIYWTEIEGSGCHVMWLRRTSACSRCQGNVLATSKYRRKVIFFNKEQNIYGFILQSYINSFIRYSTLIIIDTRLNTFTVREPLNASTLLFVRHKIMSVQET